MNNGGLLFENHEFVFYFGSKETTLEEIGRTLPALEFRNLEQFHGNDVVESRPGSHKADAHFTKETGLGLVIRTADCIPVMLATPGRGICAIHAGWRGVENDIIIKSLVHFPMDQNSFAILGPHIRERSFEVGHDVARQLTEAFHRAGGHGHPGHLQHPDPNKRFVDLTLIASQQLRSKGITQIIALEPNTFTSPWLASFRRDHKSAGRNFSFVARKRNGETRPV